MLNVEEFINLISHSDIAQVGSPTLTPINSFASSSRSELMTKELKTYNNFLFG